MQNYHLCILPNLIIKVWQLWGQLNNIINIKIISHHKPAIENGKDESI